MKTLLGASENGRPVVNLYVANHGKVGGIEDYIENLKYIFESRGFEFAVSRELRVCDVNIIIDEFSNYSQNKIICDFKDAWPNVPIVFLLTEFIERKFFVSSFNHFGSLLDSAALAWIDMFLRRVRPDFERPSFITYLRAVVFLPVVPIKILFLIFGKREQLVAGFWGRQGLRKRVAGGISKLFYMHMRYLGLRAMLRNADGIVLSHDAVRVGLSQFLQDFKIPLIGTFHPEALAEQIKNALLANKEPYVEITGTVTSFRASALKRLARDIVIFGLHHTFMAPKVRPFGVQVEESTAAFSLHPPQTKNWKYASPTRLFRAFYVDGGIPVITKHFNQHPIEDACIFYGGGRTLEQMRKLYFDPVAKMEYFDNKIAPYLNNARTHNDRLIKRLREILRGR